MSPGRRCRALALFIVAAALAAGCQKHEAPALLEAVASGDTAAVTAALDANPRPDPDQLDEIGGPVLIKAILANRPEIVKLLIAHGANVNIQFQGIPAIVFASMQKPCSEAILQSLLGAGASANGTDQEKRSTPLLEAASNGSQGCAKVLLEAGADANALDSNGDGLAWHAALSGSVPMMIFVESVKAPLQTVDRHGTTPLMAAAANGHGEVVAWLLQQGADPCAANEKGKTVRDVAEQNGKHDIVATLPACPAK